MKMLTFIPLDEIEKIRAEINKKTNPNNILITNMERVADHCSNIAGCIIDLKDRNMNLHESLSRVRGESQFYKEKYAEYSQKYFGFV